MSLCSSSLTRSIPGEFPRLVVPRRRDTTEMTEDERKAIREELVLDELSAGLGREVECISESIQDELEWRFANDTGPGMPYKEAVAKAVKAARAMRQHLSK